MIKRTLYFGNPAHLYMRNGQLCISAGRKNETDDESKIITIPIEDIGVMVLDNDQITITHCLIADLVANNAALITCNDKRMPTGLMLPLDVNTTQTEKFRAQIDASEPLKKQLWAQTVAAKLKNQSKLLLLTGKEDAAEWLTTFARDVKSGDTDNYEARGAAIYWQNIFPPQLNFRRQPGLRDEAPPNNLLDYGYAILRAVVARGLVGSGMLPTLGIFHRNKYNAYCLADDIMEPYRPYVDQIVLQIIESGLPYTELSKDLKERLFKLPAIDIVMDGESGPLMVGLQRTTASLMKCFEGDAKKVIYPEL